MLQPVFFAVPDKADFDGLFGTGIHTLSAEDAFRAGNQSIPALCILPQGEIDQTYGFTPAALVAKPSIDHRDQSGPCGSHGCKGSHRTQILAGPSLLEQQTQDQGSEGIIYPDVLIMGIQLCGEEVRCESESADLTSIFPDDEKGNGRCQESRRRQQPEPDHGLSFFVLEDPISEGQVLGGSDETKPSASNASEQGGNQDKPEPDHDYNAHHSPVNGVPYESEIEPAEKGRS